MQDPTINLEDENSEQAPVIEMDGSAEPKLNEDPVETLDNEKTGTEEGTDSSEVPEPGIDSDPEPTELPKGAAEKDEPAEPVEFKTDYKYKVRDEEHEIEEWARPFIKDEDTLKQFKELYTRGHGLALAKEERDTYKGKFTDLEQSINKVTDIVQEYYNHPSDSVAVANTARKFIQELGLPQEMFMQYALEEFKYRQLSPEQRTAIDAQRAQQHQIATFQKSQKTLEEQNHDLIVERNNLELDRSLAEPQVSGLVQEYDSRVGTPGAFRSMVIQRGIAHGNRNVIKQPHEVVSEVAQELGKILQGTGMQAGQVGTPGAHTPQQKKTFSAADLQQQRQKPVLPNISGQGGVSPVKKGYTSLDQIRERYKELSAQS